MLKPPVIRTLRPAKAPDRESPDAKAYRAVAFATGAITTITDSGAHSFNYQGFKITLHCERTFEAHRIQTAFPNSRVPGFSGEKAYPEMGVRIHCDETKCSIFPMDAGPLKPGARYVHFLLKYNTRHMLANVSLQIETITPPSVARFTRNTKMDAAFALYKSQVEKAQQELFDELRRIVESEISNPTRGR